MAEKYPNLRYLEIQQPMWFASSTHGYFVEQAKHWERRRHRQTGYDFRITPVSKFLDAAA